MTIGIQFLNELTLEAQVTRRYLTAVPFEKSDFKPAEKSETLGRLAIHLAEITDWWNALIHFDKLDFIDFEPKIIQTTDELLSYFDELLENSKTSLSNVADDEFNKEWSMTYGEEILFTLPKKQVARMFCLNHMIHHRAQLGVYLRLLGVTVPAVYGPSADDENILLIQNINL